LSARRPFSGRFERDSTIMRRRFRSSVIDQVLQANLGARPHDANHAHDPSGRPARSPKLRTHVRHGVDRLLRADPPSQTVPTTACPEPSSHPRIMPSRIRVAQVSGRDYFSRCPYDRNGFCGCPSRNMARP
jgi:hypothetical protein